ncbi:TetR/AcrR family transcriptional regulator [Lactobacillus acetotolerans]|mgnify:CR=1 FL=1|jgi:AcrR family transcriptional regulator|uniref:TetR/AcrR family transcriptional regulator n=1 Tax=Lactobacillus acetotolerans TaxID=1600 RepID=UPI00248154F4|nr:TetR/AcrR family transcriptional regulator [Lactobacillus acetotolerans]
MSKDLRSIRSVQNIKKAFVELLQEEPFEEIKVSEIARRAGIDRQTFYLHFVDKYDLLEKMNQDFIDLYKPIIFERLEVGNSFALEKIEKIYQDNWLYIKQHRQEILSLLSIDTGQICLKSDLKKMVIQKYQEVTGKNLTSFQKEMVANLYVESFITFIKEDRKISKKEIEDLLTYIREFIS